METVIVRYRVKPEHVERNEELVLAVYAELHERALEALRYATFKLEDGVTFVHLAASEGASPLPQLRSFQEFQRELRARCDEPPVVTALTPVGSFRWGD